MTWSIWCYRLTHEYDNILRKGDTEIANERLELQHTEEGWGTKGVTRWLIMGLGKKLENVCKYLKLDPLCIFSKYAKKMSEDYKKRSEY